MDKHTAIQDLHEMMVTRLFGGGTPKNGSFRYG